MGTKIRFVQTEEGTAGTKNRFVQTKVGTVTMEIRSFQVALDQVLDTWKENAKRSSTTKGSKTRM